jgi:hypothetical protein
MRRTIGSALVVLGSLAWLGGCAATSKSAPAEAAAPAQTLPPPTAVTSTVETPGGGVERRQMVTVRAKVVDVDHDKRLVTLRGPKGNTETYEVDEAVKNFPQVRKGDEVVAKYYQAVAIRLKKHGEAEPSLAGAAAVGTAEPGEKPAGVAAHTVNITATVEKVDRAHQVVTLKGPRGNVVDVAVENPARLEKVKKGDLVEITYTEALAVAVEKAPGKKKH